MTLNRVVLPAPLGPMTPTISPWVADIETWSRATTPPNPTLSSSTRSVLASLRESGGGRTHQELLRLTDRTGLVPRVHEHRRDVATEPPASAEILVTEANAGLEWVGGLRNRQHDSDEAVSA